MYFCRIILNPIIMKKGIIICLCVTVIAMFSSCSKNDGVYEPAKKIQKIYTVNDGGEKVLAEAWHWDGNTLTSIDRYYEALTFTDQFSYDTKNRLISVENANATVEITYDGNKLDEIKEYAKGVNTIEPAAKYDFEYKGNKISKIEMEVNFPLWDKEKSSNPLCYVLPELVPAVDQFVKKCPNTAKNEKITILLTWDGNNVKSMDISITGFMPVSETVDLTYDNKNNPFYGMVSQMGSEVVNNFFLNKNNVLTMTTRIGAVQDMNVEYTYEYDGKYPTSVTSLTTDNEGNEEMETTIYEY